MWRDSIVTRLREAARPDLAEPLDKCHREKSVMQCCSCRAARVFWNRCELKHCPICAERLAKERRKTVEWWTKEIHQPKHLVLTALNTTNLCAEYFLWFKQQFAKLRRSKCARNWRGGFYSIETTWNESGAHVHLHILLDCNWVNISEVAIVWGRLLQQEFAICKIKDARDKSYLAEVAKYVVKGSELASWTGSKLVTFLDAIANVRMFGVFGTLYKKRAELRDWLDTLRSLRNKCDCGCKTFRVLDEQSFEWQEIVRELNIGNAPPPKIPAAEPQLSFALK